MLQNEVNKCCTSVFKSKEEAELKKSFTHIWIKLINQLEKENNTHFSK